MYVCNLSRPAYANRDGYSEIYVAFRDLHSENKIQRITFTELQRVKFTELHLENYRELYIIIEDYRELSENNIQSNIQRITFRITFRDLYTFM